MANDSRSIQCTLMCVPCASRSEYKHLGRPLLHAALFLLLMVFFTSAVQPTQQASKQFLNPFYSSSFAANTNNTFNLSIAPPDGLSEVKSAIITLDIWMSPTVTFTLWVNNQSCSNPTYTISTTFAGAGEGRAYFDCTRIINQSGTYQVKIKSSSVTGASNSWLDLTYLNAPAGSAVVHGTEYSPNDTATIWVQLTDSQNLPVTTGSCLMDLFSPLTNGTHPYVYEDAPLINSGSDDGVYYFDWTVPDTMGVFLATASCTYSYQQIFAYEPDSGNQSVAQRQSGTWTGDTLALNDKADGVYEKCTVSGGAGCISNYTFSLQGFSITNVSGINLYWSGQVGTGAANITFFYWNGTRFFQLTNTLISTATGQSQPVGVDEYLTNLVPASAFINNSVKIKLQASQGGVLTMFNNWLSLEFNNIEGAVTQVKGGGEIHVTNIPSASANATLLILQPNFTDLNTKLDNLLTNTTGVQGNFTQRFDNLDANLSRLENNSYSNYSAFKADLLALQQQINSNFTTSNTQILNAINGNFTLIYGQINSFEHSTDYNFSIVHASLYNINSTLAGLGAVQDNLYTNLTVINSNLTIIKNNTFEILTMLNASNFNVSQALATIQGQLAGITTLQEDLNAMLGEIKYEMDWAYRYLRVESGSDYMTRIKGWLGG